MQAPIVTEQPSRVWGGARGAKPAPLRASTVRGALIAVVACVALAALSAALLPTVPSYDPWAWIGWGREIVDPHLSFAVGGGPSWKPLPVIFTTIFALFGGAAPTLWVILARAGGMLGLVAAFRLASRLAGGGAWGAVAGVLAGAGIVLTQQWGYYMLRGTSEPLLIATSLWALDRAVSRRHATAFVLAVATGLLRPEAWPFICAYGVWIWVREPPLRPLVLVGLASIPLLWFVPPWIASGQPFLAATHAHEYNGHLGSSPVITALRRGATIQVLPALVGSMVAVALAFRDRLTVWLAALCVGWWVVVVGMTIGGFPGLERFFLPAAAVVCVLAGAGIVRLAGVGTRISGWLPVVLTIVLVAAAAPFATQRTSVLRAQEPIAARAVTHMDQLSAAVVAIGGHRGAYPCESSFTAVNHSAQTALAWKLRVTFGRVGTTMRHQGLMFLGPHDTIDGAPPRVDPRLTQRQLIARAGVWRVYRLTAPGADTRCVGR